MKSGIIYGGKGLKEVLFVGRLTMDNTPCAGEVMKNLLFCERLDNSKCKLDRFNVTMYKRRIFLPYLYIKLALFLILHHYSKIIVSTHDSLALRVINVLGHLGQSSRIDYWVIGGGIAKKIETGELSSPFYKKLNKIIVEDHSIQMHFVEMGFREVITLPNFKPYFKIVKDETTCNNKFVFVSRITPMKGCDIILSAVKQLNRQNVPVDVDFYGFIEKGYPFEEYIDNIPNIHYKGVLSLKTVHDYEFLAQYKCMLFPTFYPNEGFPGTLIDGLIAGLPIIATDWRYNSHILENEKQGWLIAPQDSNELALRMMEIIDGKYNLKEISENCQHKAKLFDTNMVLSDKILSEMCII